MMDTDTNNDTLLKIDDAENKDERKRKKKHGNKIRKLWHRRNKLNTPLL